MTNLRGHNARVRAWANKQPPKYRKSALAFGYPCDQWKHEFTQDFEWIAANARHNEVDISASTLKRHITVFKRDGVIEVTRHRQGKENRASTFRVHFDKVITEGTEDMSIRARFTGTICAECRQQIAEGDEMEGNPGEWRHVECPEASKVTAESNPWEGDSIEDHLRCGKGFGKMEKHEGHQRVTYAICFKHNVALPLLGHTLTPDEDAPYLVKADDSPGDEWQTRGYGKPMHPDGSDPWAADESVK